MAKRTVRDLPDLKGARVFVRVDYNVPLEGGRITDDTRIRASLPTLDLLRKAGARLVLASHLGRPKKGPAPEFSLKPVADHLQNLLGGSVAMAPDCVGPDVRKMAEALHDGDVLVLENVRFHKEEEANDRPSPRGWWPTAGPPSSSTTPSAPLPAPRRGRLAPREDPWPGSSWRRAALPRDGRDTPAHPYVAVLGGAKVSDKITVIESLLPKVDALLVGGGMAYTFLRAEGLVTGKSLVEEDKVELARRLLEKAGPKLRLPMDHVVASAFKEDAERRTLPVDQIPADWMGLDIGPATVSAYTDVLRSAQLVFWNGPMGVFEMKPFAEGTLAMARALAGSSGTSIVGQGDASPPSPDGTGGKIDHVSTGGASLEFLGGDILPGVACLEDAQLRKRLLAGNWKMYKTVPEAVALAQAVRAGVARPLADRDVLVAPPFTALTAVADALRGGPVLLAAQNMHWEREGAYTGEVSPVMLKDAGCSHVIGVRAACDGALRAGVERL